MVTSVKLASLGRGPYVALVERPGDHAKGKTRHFTAYFIEKVDWRDVLKLDPERALFILSETGFYRPADWRLDFPVDPELWFSPVMRAIHQALEPFERDAPRPN